MKKLITTIFSVIFALAIAIVPNLSRSVTGVYADYFVEGGRFTVDFEEKTDEEYFQLFTEFDKKPWVMDGKMFTWSLAEQKMILKKYLYSDVDVSVTISTINKSGKIDAGIYVQASEANYRLDAITAWCVNVEHGASQKTFNLKLHRFEQATWKGAKVEIMGIPYYSDTVRLRVVVKSGMLYAFLNESKTPTFNYFIGEAEGQVGLRSFYAPNMFDDFSVTGSAHEPDKTLINELIAKAEEKLLNADAITEANELNFAMQNAKIATTQSQIDKAVKALQIALERAIAKRSLTELNSLIAEAEKITNENGGVYTANSWNSFVAVKEICKKQNEESSEYDISYWYARLQAKISGLIAYNVGGMAS